MNEKEVENETLNSPQNMRTKFIYENYRYCDII